MDNTFQKNQLKPGDPGYEYDKQVDFDTAEKVEAGWDSSEEDFWSQYKHVSFCRQGIGRKREVEVGYCYV